MLFQKTLGLMILEMKPNQLKNNRVTSRKSRNCLQKTNLAVKKS